ncbi:hypothetical protein IEO70_03575 [Bacillus sp. AGMB 02131]|uniref:DNA mimic protein DMP19 C-terminal domain-containing protein n=2 Tax=Peribacillus faecalis TaxID=2772559 RepID=A0A927H9C3_9BACI|nr:hypothetical protein [Peribacillus faecalis]MBD3107435.1 hypothetical protein [Peribacillus faecalis]
MSEMSKTEIRSAVIQVLMEKEFPSESAITNEAHLVFQYYCEMESGGHEGLLRWKSQYIKDIGITVYLAKLTAILKKINAFQYAAILEEYGEEMWNLFVALEKGEIDEDQFYEIVHKADYRYYHLNDEIDFLIENYFSEIYEQLTNEGSPS